MVCNIEFIHRTVRAMRGALITLAEGTLRLMKLLTKCLPLLALAASCSKVEDGGAKGETPLCTAQAAGTVTAAKAAELVNAVRQSHGASRAASCARFTQVLADGSKAGIPNASDCRWDDRNSNGNPNFLISLHLTQLKGQVREICGDLE
jgi:hypothetical protein